MTRLIVPWFLCGVLVGLMLALAFQLRSERAQANARPLVVPAARVIYGAESFRTGLFPASSTIFYAC